MKITESQLAVLASYHCERLSESSDNFMLVSDFYNSKNPSLVDTLQDEAYSDDENNRLAYYVVKDKDGNIMLFFSLKCGLLYDEFLEGDRLKEMKACYDRILTLSKDPSLSGEDKSAVAAILEDETLIAYYAENMGFELADEHCAAIPMYDFTCQFMSQKTCELARKSQSFFDNFTPQEI